MRMRVPISLWLLATFATAAFAISCYECDSINDKYCGETFIPDDIAQTDCDALQVPERLQLYYPQRPATACLTKFYDGLPGEKYFIRRSCYFGNIADSLFTCDEHPDPLVPYLKFFGCFACDDDLCNASARGIISWTTVLAGLLLWLWMH
ncbi:uncharacterized protein LOC115630704 [Scaptodrosophila lebanonensis]|uniref:Uncharacterized protein LOC115630704 n=1 Tax=Drosophila lebanonensis TaxID=7225 RepID=A0A6J2U7S6_DROLE|nr:uncharacterized protein LOC115630704 [Scaptodrosophila lebanonensis]